MRLLKRAGNEMAISFRNRVMAGCWLINSWFCFSMEIPECAEIYFCTSLMSSTLLSLIIEKSLESVEIWWLRRIPIPERAISSIKIQNMTASPRGVFFCSIHRQSGKNNVATTAPIANGMRKSLAKYKPAVKRNRRSSFFNPEEELMVMLNGLYVLFQCVHECKHINSCIHFIIALRQLRFAGQ